jgi:hypothetical protein
MNRTIKAATVETLSLCHHPELESHLDDFIKAYNYGPMPQDPERPHAPLIYLQSVDFRARTTEPAPANAGT